MATIDTPDKLLPTTDAAKVFRNQYNRSQQEFMDKGQRDRFKAFYQAYRAYSEIQDDDLKSNLAMPLIAAHVDAFVARLAGARPIIDVMPRESGDVEKAHRNRLLIDYQWDTLGMLFHILMLSKSAMIHGIAWGKLTWRKEVRERLVKRAPEPSRMESMAASLGLDASAFLETFRNLTGAGTTRTEEVTVWDNPFFQVLEPDAIYPDPDGYSIDTCEYLIERSVCSLQELEAMDGQGDVELDSAGMSALKEALEAGNLLGQGQGQQSVQEEASSVHGGTRQPGQSSDPHKQQFHLLEKWTDGKVEWAVEEAPQANLIRSQNHTLGMKPYIRYTPDPLPNELIGTSVTERLYALNMHMNTTINAINDATLATINAILLVPRSSQTEIQHLRNRSRGWAFVDPNNPPAYLSPPELKGAGYRYIQELRQMSEDVGGTNTFRGIGGDGDTTATEADLLARASGTKAGMMLQVLNDQPLKRLGRLWVKLNSLNITEDRVVRILGDRADPAAPPQTVTIRPEDIAMRGGVEMDVTIDIASNDPDTRQFKMRRMGEQFTAMAQATQWAPELRAIVRQYAVEIARLGDLPNPDALLRQGLQEAQQMAAQAQALQAQGGALPRGQNVGNEGQQIAADRGAQNAF